MFYDIACRKTFSSLPFFSLLVSCISFIISHYIIYFGHALVFDDMVEIRHKFNYIKISLMCDVSFYFVPKC